MSAANETGFWKVFKSNDPFREPFKDSIACRLILYPIYDELDSEQFRSLGRAINALGEDTFALRVLAPGEEHPEFLIDSKDFQTHRKVALDYPHLSRAFYSLEASWGLIVSDEWHAVVGGSREFIDVLTKHFPLGADLESEEKVVPLHRQGVNFIREQVGSAGHLPEWAPQLLTHVYGAAEARKMISEVVRTVDHDPH